MTKLVIVDDHEALREGLVALLRGHGMEVVGTAGNVAGGIDLVEHAEPDVAIVDIRLPDGSGIDLTRDLRDGVENDASRQDGAVDAGATPKPRKRREQRESVERIFAVRPWQTSECQHEQPVGCRP